jgi:hypothetical protein
VTGSSERAADDVVVNAGGQSEFFKRSTFQSRVPRAQDVRRPAIITDMQVEGVWLALSQRSDFTGFLQQHGGSLAALTENLHMQAQQIHAGASEGPRQGQKS